MPNAFTFVFAFIVVLALIAGAAWLVRRFAGNRLGTNANRGRMPRLAVIDAAAVDGRRRLVLVRRDNVEHLLMIGGPTDIVVEPNIVRATPGRDQMPQRPSSGSEQPAPRLPPLAETGWAETDGHRSEMLDHPESQMPEPRPVRPPFVDAVRRPATAERRSDPLAGFTPEPMSRTDIRGARPARGEPAMPPRPPVRPAEPAPASPSRAAERPAFPPPLPTSATPSPSTSSADQNLAEMAKRLEAALRRPADDSKPEAAPPVVPEPPGRARSGEISAVPAPHGEPSVAPPVAPPGPKSGFEHLEDEMASLLGRPKSPS
ncbi:MAG: flagellar biosynthetic protein FliO [Nitrobacter sp.]